jgi:hypothetical protein
MAEELDRKLIPGFMQDAFKICLGAAFKATEAMKQPVASVKDAFGEAQALIEIPEGTPDEVEAKAKAIAGNVMIKANEWMGALRSAGAKFTDEAK